MSTTLTTKDVTHCPDGAVSVSGREGTRLKLKRVEREKWEEFQTLLRCAELYCIPRSPVSGPVCPCGEDGR